LTTFYVILSYKLSIIRGVNIFR